MLYLSIDKAFDKPYFICIHSTTHMSYAHTLRVL